MLKKNSLHRVTIEGYSSQGMGVARIDGMVVFVNRGISGEECVIRIVKVQKTIAYAIIEEVITASEYRTEPSCPYFGKCGGCTFWHMDYHEELKVKRQRVEDALRKIGDIAVEVPDVIGADVIIGYRNKVQFPVAPEAKIGFYRARSHDVIEVDNCMLQSEAAAGVSDAVRKWMQKYNVSAYDEKTRKGIVRHIFVRSNKHGEILVCLVVNKNKVPFETELCEMISEASGSVKGILLNVNLKDTNVILGDKYRLLRGEDYLIDSLCGKRFKLSVPTFFQVNSAQAEKLYRIAGEFAGLTGTETLLDLYCGAGSIGISLSDKVGKLIGVETVAEAVENAVENAEMNGVQNAEFICADAGEAALELSERGLLPDVIIVDPPRKGISQEVIQAMGTMNPEKIVYVSCDPATMARDIKLLGEKGYVLKKVCAVDMFPRTSHVECACLLIRCC